MAGSWSDRLVIINHNEELGAGVWYAMRTEQWPNAVVAGRRWEGTTVGSRPRCTIPVHHASMGRTINDAVAIHFDTSYVRGKDWWKTAESFLRVLFFQTQQA